MNHKFFKKSLPVSIIFVFLFLCFFVFLKPVAAIEAGDLVKITGNDAVYYIGENGQRYVFPQLNVYNSWYQDFSAVKTITLAELQTYAIGGNMTVRPGTKLIKIQSDPSVYAVSSGGFLHKIDSEARAVTLYGADWVKRVVDVSDAFFVNYTVNTPINSDQQPDGTLIRYEVLPNSIYLIQDGKKRLFASDDILAANGYVKDNVITTTLNYADGNPINEKEKLLSAPPNTLKAEETPKTVEVTQIFVTTDHDQIAANGQAKAIISATLKDNNGQVVTTASDQVIFMSNNLGTLSSTSAKPSGGIAQTIFTAGQKIGTAEITASVGNISKTINIDIVSVELIQPGQTMMYDPSNISPLYKDSAGSGEPYNLTWNKIEDVDYYIVEESYMNNFNAEITPYTIPTANCSDTICSGTFVHTNNTYNSIKLYYRVKGVRNTVEGLWNNTEKGVTVDQIIVGTGI